MAYIQKNNPFPVTSCGRRRTFTQGGNPGDDRTKESAFKSDPDNKKETRREDKQMRRLKRLRKLEKKGKTGTKRYEKLEDKVYNPFGE